MNTACLRSAGLAALFLLAAGVAAYAQEGASTSFNGHSYTVFEDGCSWEEAKRACELRGGHLVTINSRAEQKAVASLVKSGAKKFYWIGGYRAKSSHFLWVTGEKFSFTSWASGSPSDGTLGNKDALMLYKSSGIWKDENGDKPSGKASALQNYGYVCEWDDEVSAAAEAGEDEADEDIDSWDDGADVGISLKVGKRVKLFASPGAIWASSDSSVAKVDRHGVVTALSPGSAVITAKGAGGLTVRVEE